MKIEYISEISIKAILSAEDLQRYHITYDDLGSDSRVTKSIILAILTKAKMEFGFDASHGKLLVEVYQEEDGGCVFALSILGAPAERGWADEIPLAFVFEDADALFSCCKRIGAECNDCILKSFLFAQQGNYILLVYPKHPYTAKMTVLLSEYAQKLKVGKFCRAYYTEHAKLLLDQCAVSRIASL